MMGIVLIILCLLGAGTQLSVAVDELFSEQIATVGNGTNHAGISQVPTSTPPSSRRLYSTGYQPYSGRNNKLMLVLAAFREALMKDRNKSHQDSTSSASTVAFQTAQSPVEKLTPRRWSIFV